MLFLKNRIISNVQRAFTDEISLQLQYEDYSNLETVLNTFTLEAYSKMLATEKLALMQTHTRRLGGISFPLLILLFPYSLPSACNYIQENNLRLHADLTEAIQDLLRSRLVEMERDRLETQQLLKQYKAPNGVGEA